MSVQGCVKTSLCKVNERLRERRSSGRYWAKWRNPRVAEGSQADSVQVYHLHGNSTDWWKLFTLPGSCGYMHDIVSQKFVILVTVHVGDYFYLTVMPEGVLERMSRNRWDRTHAWSRRGVCIQPYDRSSGGIAIIDPTSSGWKSRL